MSTYAETKAELRGLVLSMPVPFAPASFTIDRRGLRSNIEFWLESGVEVIMITTGTSDFVSLSDAEISEITSLTVETVSKRAHVIACTDGWWLGQTIEFVNRMLSGDFEGCRPYLDTVLPLRRLAASINNHLAIKHLMDCAGLAGGPPRPLCMLPLTADQETRIRAAAEKTGLLKSH